jgi:hypothetical protein
MKTFTVENIDEKRWLKNLLVEYGMVARQLEAMEY